MHDIIVIGSGPAGLTAALYARRANKSVLILEKDSFGGQITHSPKIENFPGHGIKEADFVLALNQKTEDAVLLMIAMFRIFCITQE